MSWFEDLYNRQIYLDLYAAGDSQLARREVEALLEIMDISPGVTILDVCCGYGRHALELARRGFRVTGLDLAPRQIESARSRAQAEGLQIDFQIADAREMKFDRTFQITLNLFTSFGFFPTDQEHEAMLARIWAATAPGGRFLLDFWNREQVLRNFKPLTVETRSDGIVVEKRWVFDAINGRINWENQVHLPDGKVEVWSHSIRAFTLSDLVGMFNRVGFRVEQVWGDWEGSDYSLDSPQMILLGRKDR